MKGELLDCCWWLLCYCCGCVVVLDDCKFSVSRVSRYFAFYGLRVVFYCVFGVCLCV